MTLIRKISVGILAALFIVFLGTYLITLNNARNFYISQLNSNAQDTATSLSLSLSRAIAHHDLGTMKSMVEVVFDQEDFSLIEVRDEQGNILVSRENQSLQSSAPDWFVDLIEWPSTVKSAVVMGDGKAIGDVLVTANSHYACHALWRNAVQLLFWYVLFAFLFLLSVFYMNRRLLAPLKRVINQAQRIAANDFSVETIIPSTLELKSLTLAMNQIANHLRVNTQNVLQKMEIFRYQALQDEQTGLGNLSYFYYQLHSLLSDATDFSPGVVISVVIEQHINDEPFLALAKACKDFAGNQSNIIMAKLNENRLAILTLESDSALLARRVSQWQRMLREWVIPYANIQLILAITPCRPQQTPTILLQTMEEDLALERTMPQQLPGWSGSAYDLNSIVNSLTHRRVVLYSRSLVANGSLFHTEYGLSLLVDHQRLYPQAFMPVAERMNMADQLDLLLLDLLVEDPLIMQQPVAMLLSESTVLNSDNQKRFLESVDRLPLEKRKHLHLAFAETMINRHLIKVMAFGRLLHKRQIKTGIHHAGLQYEPMDYWQQLSIDFVVLHPGLHGEQFIDPCKRYIRHYFRELGCGLSLPILEYLPYAEAASNVSSLADSLTSAVDLV